MSKLLKRAFIALGVVTVIFIFSIIYYVIIPMKDVDVSSIKKEIHETNSYSDQSENMKEKLNEYKTKEELSDIRLDLTQYESTYKVLMNEIDNEGIDYAKADAIYRLAKENMLEIMRLDVEDKYKDNLKEALTYICISMDEYKKGNLDESVKYIDIAKEYYKKYEKIFE